MITPVLWNTVACSNYILIRRSYSIHGVYRYIAKHPFCCSFLNVVNEFISHLSERMVSRSPAKPAAKLTTGINWIIREWCHLMHGNPTYVYFTFSEIRPFNLTKPTPRRILVEVEEVRMYCRIRWRRGSGLKLSSSSKLAPLNDGDPPSLPQHVCACTNQYQLSNHSFNGPCANKTTTHTHTL